MSKLVKIAEEQIISAVTDEIICFSAILTNFDIFKPHLFSLKDYFHQ